MYKNHRNPRKDCVFFQFFFKIHPSIQTNRERAIAREEGKERERERERERESESESERGVWVGLEVWEI
jgi:hypothetical protein